MARKKRPGALPILVARFCYFCMEIGLTKAFGVLIYDFEEQLQTSNAIVGLMMSLSLTAMYLCSPIAKVILHRCSHRRMLTTLCGFGAGCALICTSFTRSVLGLSLLFATMGFCCAIINLQLIVLIFDYYQEDYPFASCISVFGIPIGAVFLPPATEKLLELYGLSGSLMIIGAFTLNMLPIGLALKEKRTAKVAFPNEGYAYEAVDNSKCNGTAGPSDSLEITLSKKGCLDSHDTAGSSNPIMMSAGTSSDYRRLNEEQFATSGNSGESIANHDELLLRKSCLISQEEITLNNIISETEQENQFAINCAERDIHEPSNDLGVFKSSSEHSVAAEIKSETAPPVGSPMTRAFKAVLFFFHMEVLVKEPLFAFLYLPVNVLFFLIIGGWALFIVLYAVEQGIDLHRAAYLPTTGAIGGVLASIFDSVALWYRPHWSPVIYIATLTLSASCFFLQTLYSSYSYLVIMSFLIGFGMYGASGALEAVMAITVSPENFPDASNLFLLTIGIGYVLSGYVSGFIQDKTGNIKLVYIFFGVATVVAIMLLVLLTIGLRRRRLAETRASAIKRT